MGVACRYACVMSDLLVSALIFAGGVVLLLVGGEALVRGSVSIAVRMRVSPLLIGLTIVAFGTSAPELSFNIMATLEGNDGLSFGNIIGSNIANIGLVLGLAAMIRAVRLRRSLVTREIPVMVCVALLACVLALVSWPRNGSAWSGEGFGRLDGVLLLASFGVFLWMSVRMGLSQRRASEDPVLLHEAEEEIHESDRSRPLWRAALMFAVGLGALLLGGHYAEGGAVGIARGFGVSDALIGLTIVAVATSLPELVVSVLAAMRGRSDIAIGNVVGSNIFNLSLVMGATALAGPVLIPQGGMMSLGVMLILSVGLMGLSLCSVRRIGRVSGGLLLLAYVLYLWSEVWVSTGMAR